jgi:hypothetical protein
MRLTFTLLVSLLLISGSLLAGDISYVPGTAPSIGTTTFNSSFSAGTTTLIAPAPSPQTALNVGPLLATGWDITGTAAGGNVSISGVAGGENPGGAGDFAIRAVDAGSGLSMVSMGVKSDDGSSFHLQSVYFRIAGATAPNIIITGYRNGVAVTGATLTVNGLVSGSWNLFDVSANTAFNSVNEFRFTQAGSTSVTITQMYVDQITIAAPVSLPLTLTDFSGQRSGNEVNLKWTTATEQNTRDFEIQRATDGTTWSGVGQIAAAGNSTQPLNYQFTDALPASTAPAWFYRLLMTDKDGQFTYSPVLRIEAAEPSTMSLAAYPNPFGPQLTLSVESPQAGNALISVTDMDGRLLLTERMPLLKGNNVLPFYAVGSLAKGVYSLTISTAAAKKTIGIIKSN